MIYCQHETRSRVYLRRVFHVRLRCFLCRIRSAYQQTLSLDGLDDILSYGLPLTPQEDQERESTAHSESQRQSDERFDSHRRRRLLHVRARLRAKPFSP